MAKPTDHITIYAPIGGIVVHKDAQEGMYVETGTRIYTIADLIELWVMLEAYESDLPWLRYGQQVAFRPKPIPGKVFEGRSRSSTRWSTQRPARSRFVSTWPTRR